MEEVRAAAKHKRAKEQPQLPEEVLKRIQVLRDNLAASFPEEDSRTRLQTSIFDDKLYFTVQHVFVDDVELLTEALMNSLGSPRSAA